MNKKILFYKYYIEKLSRTKLGAAFGRLHRLICFYNFLRRIKEQTVAVYQIKELFLFCHNDGGFKNKIVAEFGSDLELNTAKAIKKLGARKVLCFNPFFAGNSKSDDEKIEAYKRDGTDTGLPDNSVDVVFGIALLEHLSDPKKIAKEIKRILKPGGVAYLEGCPMWSGPLGHHIYCEFPDKSYHFNDATNPFAMWEHLYYDTDKEMEAALIRKGIPETHSKDIAEWIMNSSEVSRKKASDIIKEISMVEDIEITVEKDCFQKAPQDLLEKYSEEDLLTHLLRIKIKKK